MIEQYAGSTSHSVFVALVDSTTGLPKTGVAYTAVTASYARTRSARVAITTATLAAATTGFTSGGWFEVDATNQPGLYRFDVPDAAYASGAEEVVVSIKATGCRSEHAKFVLVAWNKQVAAIPNAAAGASGGLPTGDASGYVRLQATTHAGATIPTVTTTGTATNLTNLPSAPTDWLTAAGVKADAVTKIQNGLATPTNITAGTITTVTNLTNLPSAPAGWIATATFAAGATLPRVTLADTVTTYTGNTPQTGDAFARIGATGSALTSLATQASVNTLDDFVDTEVAAILARLNLIPTMASGTVVVGSTGSAVIVSGLPSGKSYVGQRLYHGPTGEARVIGSQSFGSGNYTFNFPGTAGTTTGPFSAVTTGDAVSPAP